MGLHGDEASLFEPIRKFLQGVNLGNVEVTLILANVEAAIKDVRYIHHDLNRAFGVLSKFGDDNESITARELKSTISGDLILDLHTHSGEERFSLISKDCINPLTSNYLSLLKLKQIILISHKLTEGRSLIDNFSNSLSIETGRHKSLEAEEFAKFCIKKALSLLNENYTSACNKICLLDANEFLFNQSEEEIVIDSSIKNFVKVKKGQRISDTLFASEDFVPTLVSYLVKPHGKILLKCKEKII